ncbi:MAG: D-alanine--D-alanine ligase [Kiritimatiellae bacterium]|jgi:D-alanine-D-alanine ligase|nr:D-alanine--D-alanine ligase [Kiritimatiellia bacterium]
MCKKYKNVAVFMGGVSSEREVSLKSGKAVSNALSSAGFIVTEIDICEEKIPHLPKDIEAVFIALHGNFGEDGGIQALLDKTGIPYTGSGTISSFNSFDKHLTKQIILACGLPTPAYTLLVDLPETSMFGYPVVVKPLAQGSSIGIEKVNTDKELRSAIQYILDLGDTAMVEEFIEGRELTVGILDGQPLPIVEIKAPGGWYGYEAKYTKGATEYLVPAPIPDDIAKVAQHFAVETFEALNCSDMSRVDFRLTEDGELYILEINTIPGFTETSLLPKAAACAGISFETLCSRIMNMAAVKPAL